MEQRINFYEKGRRAMSVLGYFGLHLAKSPLEKPLLHLLEYRVSQINGCAYCLDMHSKDLRAAGETEQRLYMMDAWAKLLFTQSANAPRLPGRKRLQMLPMDMCRMKFIKKSLKSFRMKN